MNKYYFCRFPRDRKPPYTTNGIGVLSKIDKPVIKYKLNNVSELTFTYPANSQDYKFLTQINNIITYMGKPFRIVRFVDKHAPNTPPIIEVVARDFLEELKYILLPDFFQIGKKPIQMITAALQGTQFHVMTEEEAKEKGLEWWDVPTDLELNRATAWQVFQQIIEVTGGGEIYLDGYDIALVKGIGKRAKQAIRLGRNLKNIERAVDGTTIVTRVYPMGQDDLHIDYVTQGGQQYIDSKWAEVFGIQAAYVEYGDIRALGEDDPDDPNGASVLYWTACANMDAPVHCGNANLKEAKNKYVNTAGMRNKIDIPAVQYEIGYTDLAFLENISDFKYELGDVVNVLDEAYGVHTGKGEAMDYLNLEQQVIELEHHPQNATENKITMGQYKRSMLMSIYSGQISSDYIHGNTDKDNNIKEDSVEGTERTESITITPVGDSTVRITDRFGVRSLGHVYYDDTKNPRYAVCISKSVIAMGSKSGSEWQWYNVISNGKGHLDSRMWVGSLSTSLVDIMSDNGKLTIQDSLITIKDRNNIVRLKMGYAGSKFVFEMYNAKGAKTLYMDDNGEIVAINITAIGTLMTGTEGTERTVIDGNGIQGYDANGNRAGLWCNEQLGTANMAYADMALYRAGKEIFKVYNNLDGISLYSYGTPFLTSNGGATTAEGRWTLNGNTRIDTGAGYINLLNKINDLENRIKELEQRPTVLGE